MFLVYIKWFNGIQPDFCVVTETEEKAKEYINKEMQANAYSGMGVYNIVPVKLYN